MNLKWDKIKSFFATNVVSINIAIALLFALLTMAIPLRKNSLSVQIDKIQSIVRERERILEEYAYEALETPNDRWLEIPNFPSDMVLYKYNSDTIQSWIGEFPIINDDISKENYLSPYFLYKFHYVDWQNEYINPLSEVTNTEQYVNIGSKWYVVKLYARESQKVVAGLLIKTEERVAASTASEAINPIFDIDESFDIKPITEEFSNIVIGKDGKALFSVCQNVENHPTGKVSPLIWGVVLFLFFALIGWFLKKRTIPRFAIFIVGITIIRVVCFIIEKYLPATQFFSPKLYADTNLFSSFGDLLLNNLYITLLVLAFYMIRKPLFGLKNRLGKTISWLSVFAVPILLSLYIHTTLSSLIRNSAIVMDLSRVTEIDIYTTLSYISYSLLFLVLMCVLGLLFSLLKPSVRHSLFSLKNTIIYILIVSLYVLLTISILAVKKESHSASLSADKLSIERDLDLELELRRIESNLGRDVISSTFFDTPGQNIYQIEQRFSDLYFQRIKQKYHISMTICSENDMMQIAGRVVNCINHYASILQENNATPIAEGSSFFYLGNYKGRFGYLGLFFYDTSNGPINLFIEVSSKVYEENLGYPSRLIDYSTADFSIVNLPSYYSYAKYYKNKLTLHNGDYSYSRFLDQYDVSKSISQEDGYLHFINTISDDTTVFITRPVRSVFPYFVAYSYIVLLFMAVFYIALRFRKFRRHLLTFNFRKKSIRSSLTFFITLLLTLSLIAAGVGSVWFSLRYYRGINQDQMDDKIQTAHKTLSSFFDYAQAYHYLNNDDFFSGIDNSTNDLHRAMERLSSEIHSDINLYDSRGKLIHSTKQELFSKFTLSGRMNSKAYNEITNKNISRYINKERIGGLKFNSLYSALYNDNGELYAIINIPYFYRNSSISADVTQIVAAIINIIILLLLFALFVARVLSRRLTEPLTQISNKMKSIDVAKSPEHIYYKGDNELGALIESYNKMVDSLSESTRQMAQNEREKAWSDMARQIAHEIKNPLTPMKLSIQRLVKLKTNNPQAFEEKFSDISQGIIEQIDILSNTASEFSSYAKFYVEDTSIFNLYDVIKEEVVLFDNRENLRIVFTHDTQECYVYARKGQIIRVVVNLITNAIQALEQLSEKGFIKVSIQTRDNEYIVSVDDNGNGVDSENLKKLFSPNFTTKTSGNGLGLAISKSIVEQSGGKIWHQSSELGGASFSFSLPKYIEDKTMKNNN